MKQIVIGIAIIFIIGSTGFFIYSKNKPVPQKPEETAAVTPTPSPVNLLTWTDEAGFSFQYPEGTQIDKHPEDNENYANLTLTTPSKDVVNIKMSDNTFKNLDAWAADKSALDTTLEGRPAKKIIEGDLETIACIDNEVIVTISGKDLSDITKSWTFIYPTPTAAAKTNTPAPADDNVLVEE